MQSQAGAAPPTAGTSAPGRLKSEPASAGEPASKRLKVEADTIKVEQAPSPQQAEPVDAPAQDGISVELAGDLTAASDAVKADDEVLC